jgi:ABC-2 type transport system permease protein
MMASGTLVKGPGALSGDPRRVATLTATLAFMEFKLRFFGSALGYFWQLVRPLLLFGVLFVVFTKFVRFNEGVPHFPVVLLTGVVVFTFFADATSGAVTSVVARENLVRKIQFPRLVVPLSVVLTAFFNLVLNLVAVLVFTLASGVRPSATWLLAPLLLIPLVVLVVGISALLSALYVKYRDVQPIWEVVLQLLFWGTPIIYTIENVPADFQELIMMNPLAVAIQQGRHWLVPASTESAAQAIGEPVLLLIPLGVFVGVVAFSVWRFRRAEGRLAEEL